MASRQQRADMLEDYTEYRATVDSNLVGGEQSIEMDEDDEEYREEEEEAEEEEPEDEDGRKSELMIQS